jgi:hypothetical protein
MTGIGLLFIALGYSVTYWGVHAIQGEPQGAFTSYLFPFAK